MKKIKLFDPVIGISEEREIIKTLRSGFWASGSGNGKVQKFERKISKYLGSDQCIAVNSGTAALNLALSLFDLKNKDVILPSMSFISTAHAIIENGGNPIFVEVEPETLCIDPSQIYKSITKKTAAIIPVHFGGLACNLKEIQSIAKKFQLTVIEDAAHAAGASYNKKKIGRHSTAVCFSFHPVKNLAMPTGGLISINNKQHEKFRRLLLARRWCGITDRKETDYDVKELGWNYYMNEFSAAIGLEQLKKLDKLNNIRKKIAKRYSQELKIETKMPYEINCSYHFYWILVKNRNTVRKKLAEYGIETGTHYKPIHTFSYYTSKNKLKITEDIGKRIIILQCHPNLKKQDIDKIIKLTNKFS